MSNTIKLKRSSVANKVPASSDLEVGELAVNLADRKLYTKDGGGSVVSLPASVDTATRANQDGNGNVIHSTYLKNSGGLVTGQIQAGTGNFIARNVDDSYLTLMGGTAWDGGADLVLQGKDNSGRFRLRASDGTDSVELLGYPDGRLTWNGKLIALRGDYIPTTGGNATGVIAFENGVRVHAANAGAGTQGYTKFATVTIKSASCDSPLVMTMVNRAKSPTSFSVRFSGNTESNTLSAFEASGGNAAGLYIVHDDTVTWSLYCLKTGGNDRVEVVEFLNSVQADGSIDVAWVNEFASTLPAGAVQATDVSPVDAQDLATKADTSALASYLPLAGGILTGAVTFKNATWNPLGDDVQIGDFNHAGLLGIQGKNGQTGIGLVDKDNANTIAIIRGDGSNVVLGASPATGDDSKKVATTEWVNDAIAAENTIHIIDTYVNGTSGYRIWSDGYCEQWGIISVTEVTANRQVTFLKTYKSAPLVLTTVATSSAYVRSSATPGRDGIVVRAGSVNQVSTTLFYINLISPAGSDASGPVQWKASGYLATGQY